MPRGLIVAMGDVLTSAAVGGARWLLFGRDVVGSEAVGGVMDRSHRHRGLLFATGWGLEKPF